MNRKAAVKQKKDVKQCLKLLESGKLHLEDVECLADEINLKPEIGDQIQYELHKYCKRDVLQTNTNLIVKLAELCYTDASVSCFSNIGRFVGCVFYISSHLLKKERYQSALAVVSSLLIRKKEIVECSKTVSDVQSFIYVLHNTFIASATGLTSKVKSSSDETYELCHKLVIESLNVFKLTTSKQPDVGKKMLRTTTLYLQNLKHYKEEDIRELYQTLREVLKILIPPLGSLDYFLYFFSKMNQMKKPESEAELEQTLRKVVDLLMIFLGSPADVRNVFVKMIDFFWVDFDEDKWISIAEYNLLCKNPSHVELHFLLTSTIFNHGVQFLWAKYEKSWSTDVSAAAVRKMSNTIMALHRSCSGNGQLYCSSRKEPIEICYGELLTGNLQKIQYTVRLCLKNKLPKAVSLSSVSRESFRLAIECLENLKYGCCEKQRVHSWKSSVIHLTNTVEDICRLGPSDDNWLFLRECSRDVLKEVINSHMELPFGFARIKILFQRWHNASLKLQNYQDALYACVAYYVFYPDEEKDIMAMWLQTKSESSNQIIQEMTMANLLKTSDQNLQEFDKTYKSSKVCLKSALLTELKAYSSCLPDTFQNPNTSFNLAIRIWKRLEEMKLDLWESSLAMSSVILASLAGENEKLPNGFHEKYQKLVNTFMNQRQKEKLQCRSLLHAANLSFSLFLYNVKTSETSEGKMDTTQMVLGHLKKEEEEKVKLGEDVDLNLTCDVIPSSRHLTVELETNYLNELNRIVDLWSEALKESANGVPVASELDLWLRNVKQVANMYEMFGEYRRALTTWLMFYRIGKLRNDSGASLLGLSHLIKNCADVDASEMKEEAELISETLGSEAAEKQVLAEYALAMATNYLKNKKPENCLEHLSRAKKILESLPTTIKTYTLNAKFWCLVSQFLVVYKEYEAVFDYPVGTDVRVFAFKAFSYANGRVKSELIKSTTQLECTEHVLAMLEVNLWAYHLHGVYRQTDFMRFFLDGLYQIVQKLFLPTRTAEMLARLAQVDIICEKGADCQEKVNKLKSILTTLSSTGSETVKLQKPTSPYLKVPQKGEFDSAAGRPISPVRFINKCPQSKDIDLSPIQLYLKDAKTPKAAEHGKKCKCRLCQNLLIQTLTMQTYWLEAEIHNLKNNTKQAAGCYRRACEVLDRLEHLGAEQSNLLRLELTSGLKDPGQMEPKLPFLQFHSASFLIRFALFESSSLKSVTENVLKTIQRVNKLINNLSHEEKLLRWTFTELKLFCVLLNKGTAKTPKKRTPVSLNRATEAVTPLAGAPVGRTPVIAKSDLKREKSPLPSADVALGNKNPSNDITNTAFVEVDNSNTIRKLIRPRRLNFQTNETETKTKTVRKASKDSLASVSSRKLDFDISGDLFEEPPAPVRTVRATRKPSAVSSGAAKPTKDGTESVKIYVDSKNDGKKPKKSETKKLQSAKPRKK